MLHLPYSALHLSQLREGGGGSCCTGSSDLRVPGKITSQVVKRHIYLKGENEGKKNRERE